MNAMLTNFPSDSQDPLSIWGMTWVSDNGSPLSLQLEDPGEGQGSGAHMISTARVPADKPVRIAFSLDNASGKLCTRGGGHLPACHCFVVILSCSTEGV